MSNKEKIIRILDEIPDYKLGYILAYAQGVASDEEKEDAFCQRMMENYKNDPDPEKDEIISLDDAIREWGLV